MTLYNNVVFEINGLEQETANYIYDSLKDIVPGKYYDVKAEDYKVAIPDVKYWQDRLYFSSLKKKEPHALRGLEYDYVWIDEAGAIPNKWNATCTASVDEIQSYKYNPVTKPVHYNKSGIECIQAIEASMTKEEFEGYLKGNILKYMWRYKYKNGIEDLKKAQWYQNKLIEVYSKNGKEETQACK